MACLVAGLAAGILFYLMPEPLTIWPPLLPLALIAAMLIPAILFHRAGRQRLNEIFAYLGLGITTLALAVSLALLIVHCRGIRPVIVPGSGGVMAEQCAGVCVMVLAARRRWPEPAGSAVHA